MRNTTAGDITPAGLRQGLACRLAVRLGLDGGVLYKAAAAAWDNLGCTRGYRIGGGGAGGQGLRLCG